MVMPALPLLAAVPALAVAPLAPLLNGVVAVRPALPLLDAVRPAVAPLGAAVPAGAALAPALEVGDAELAGVVSAPHAAAAEAKNITKRDVRYLFILPG
jgi:hypothetical protein